MQVFHVSTLVLQLITEDYEQHTVFITYENSVDSDPFRLTQIKLQEFDGVKRASVGHLDADGKVTPWLSEEELLDLPPF